MWHSIGGIVAQFKQTWAREIDDGAIESACREAGLRISGAHWLALVHATSGLVQKMFTAPLRTHDLSSVVQLHPELQAGDVLVADRGFCSFAHLALLAARGVQAVFRMHQTFIVDFTPARSHVEPRIATLGRGKGQPRSRWLKQLGPLDRCVEWFKPSGTARPQAAAQAV